MKSTGTGRRYCPDPPSHMVTDRWFRGLCPSCVDRLEREIGEVMHSLFDPQLLGGTPPKPDAEGR
jgi:hypothetical protein